MKDCKELKHLLCDYLNNDLDKKACEMVEKHISQCAECREFIEDINLMITRCRKEEHIIMPDDMKNELKRCLNNKMNKGENNANTIK